MRNVERLAPDFTLSSPKSGKRTAYVVRKTSKRDRVGLGGQPTAHRGQRAAVVVSPEQYERMLQAVEDAEDVTAFDEAMAEEGPNIPWAQVKADLGWA